MHALQNYGAEKPAFDGEAYTISSTYYTGTGILQLYVYHITPPIAGGGGLEYYITQLGSYAMTYSRERFVEGASTFRNARNSAQRNRDSLIQAANARARQSDVDTPPEAEITVAVAEYEESTDRFVDCEDYPSQAVGIEDYTIPGDVDEEPALLQYLCMEDEEPSQESISLGTEPAISLATSFTSSFSAPSQTSSKRTRAPHSPPSNSQPHKKHVSTRRTRQSASRRAAGSSMQALTSTGSTVLPPALAKEY
ncbi:hypothetical protein C8A01DRAFT_20803 [Parachaetomium inaequale]|uniref:Uncharacterized protein n=1 Tax=Parachaetomium inaequale TaxID=2588326 RepID=A0AAN6SLU6_9PEZI|nr:hypothetical protein C8A01DRAFT_20803 [Parachaetomium inaequale]